MIKEKRIEEFEKMAFGIFVHWGLYSQMGRGEWIMHQDRIPKEQYRKLQSTFTAEDFDGTMLARLAKKAGAKYMVLTTRHHEGFSLYDTRGLSDYDVMHSPAGRDLIAEYVQACRKEGLVPFFYHTTLDWYQPSFENDFDAYLDYLYQSVEILCTRYGKIGGLWFDGNWSRPQADWKLDRLYGMIRRYQPDAMIINNTGLDDRGRVSHREVDSVTFEQGMPALRDQNGKYVASEMCMTMNDHWGYGKGDFHYKSPGECIRTLCLCRKAGANLLLNIGPMGQGAIPEMSEALALCIGEWMNLFGESIYTGKPAGIQGERDDFGLAGDEGSVYLFVFDLGISGNENVTVGKRGSRLATFSGIHQKIKKIQWMDNGQELSFMQDPEQGMLTLHATGFDYGCQYVVRIAKGSIA